ncbi:MAG: L-histidine N(alpha)-methyltransferase [Actinomycetota bacterium]|nr:L-histidine N(alpha)-methyltransferase [Actinomycetota bacterium]
MTDRSKEIIVDVHITPEDLRKQLIDDVAVGMSGESKSIPPVWFYDREGSRLFAEITNLPEYYPTRAERRLLHQHCQDIVGAAPCDTLVELGAGACEKTRVLLDAMAARGILRSYIPFDVSDEFLRTSAEEIRTAYDGLDVHAVVGDFRRHLNRIPRRGRRMIAFLGGTIGNFRPVERQRFLFDLNCSMDHDEYFVLGSDLVKDYSRMVTAYDDASGVTAAFNKNVLRVLNRELRADFDVSAFDHVAKWNDQERWIEMRLRSLQRQSVRFEVLGSEVEFLEDEELLTEISAKFTVEEVVSELSEAGFVVDGTWGADDGEFLLTLAHPYC